MADIHGFCGPTFESVRSLLQQQFVQGKEVGASICVNIDGKNVIDLWGGHTDAQKSKPWEKDTITGVFSSTKVVSTLAAHILVDRGLLDVNKKVATCWPEFGSNGKDNVKVSHILSHSSGVPAWDGIITPEEMHMCRMWKHQQKDSQHKLLGLLLALRMYTTHQNLGI